MMRALALGRRRLSTVSVSASASQSKPAPLPLRQVMSGMFVPMLKEAPQDAVVRSHIRLTRAGFIRQMASGVYCLLPLAYRSLQKIENIIDEEMRKIGGDKLQLPMLTPAEAWKKSGRWASVGDELFKLKDRRDSELSLSATCEEGITQLVNEQVSSYRQLPIRLYQIGTKFRDEIRPRFGLLRAREFCMKDMYSFDQDSEAAMRSYSMVSNAYKTIFRRLGLNPVVVAADCGDIGGTRSDEFHIPADIGDDLLLRCKRCSYAANVALAVSNAHPEADIEQSSDDEKVLALLSVEYAGLENLNCSVHSMEDDDQELMFVLTPLGREPRLLSLKEHTKNVKSVAFTRVRKWIRNGAARVKVFIDRNVVASLPNELDEGCIIGDFVLGRSGDSCRAQVDGSECAGELHTTHGIEIAHVFHLGEKYSSVFGAGFTSVDGTRRLFNMGCYGIGLSRLLAAIAEKKQPDDLIQWPMSVAPFRVLVLANDQEKNFLTATDLYDKLQTFDSLKGEVVLDDRDIRIGVKFRQAELMGVPVVVVVGRDFAQTGKVELQWRNETSRLVAYEEVSTTIADLVERELEIPNTI